MKASFPDVQFLITTHDEVWVRQMQASGLIRQKAQAHFHSWSVDDGPTYEVGVLPLEEIQQDLDAGDVPAAAARLRRNLESVMFDLAVQLRGNVMLRPQGDYDLGDLTSAVKGAHTKWLKQAADSANSWNNEAAKVRVQQLKTARAAAVLAQEGEHWAVNSSIHYNDWATMSKADFAPVVEAWREFFSLFTCDNPECESWIYVAGDRGREDALRCSCGTYDLNLRKK